MLIVTALLGLGAASAAARYLVAAGAPRRVAAAAILTSRRIAAFGSLGSCGLGLLLVLAYLLAGAGATTITLPLGLPGLGIPGPGIPGPGIAGGGLIDGSLYDGSLTLALDGLSGFFLLLLMAAGAAASVAALDGPGDYDATAPCLPVFLAAMALTLLAGDAFALMLGFELMSLASFALVLTRHEDATVRSAALQCIGMAAVGAACLIPALALLADGAGWDLRFAAIRALPPEGWRATLVLVLALVGAGSRAGLAPLHVLAAARPCRRPCPCFGAAVGRHDQGRAVRADARAVRPLRAGAAGLVGRAAAGAGRRRRRSGRAARQHGE